MLRTFRDGVSVPSSKVKQSKKNARMSEVEPWSQSRAGWLLVPRRFWCEARFRAYVPVFIQFWNLRSYSLGVPSVMRERICCPLSQFCACVSYCSVVYVHIYSVQTRNRPVPVQTGCGTWCLILLHICYNGGSGSWTAVSPTAWPCHGSGG